MEARTVEIFLDLDSETYDLFFEKEFVALAMAATGREPMEETMEARGGALEGRWWRIFHKYVDLCLTSMNLG
jgi:hypothetical protein